MILWILAASLIPAAVFLSFSYYHDIARTKVSLETAVNQGVQRIDILLRTADNVLSDVAEDIDPNDPNALSRLQRIVYEYPHFQEIGIINNEGFLILTSLDKVTPPAFIKPENRSNPEAKTLQILGPMKTTIMQKESIILSLPTQGQGEVNALVNPFILTVEWGCPFPSDLGPDGFFAYINRKTGEILAGSGRLPTDANINLNQKNLNQKTDPIRFAELSQNGDVLVIGVVSKAWILNNWKRELLFGGPITALCTGLLLTLFIRLSQRSQSLDHELNIGLRNQEFVVHYQPIINLETGKCVGSEALLRWRHPEQGVLLPDIFIPIAEKTGLINTIGEWLIKRIVQEQAPLYNQFPELYTSINLSPKQLHSGSLDKVILWLLEINLCTLDHFVFEVTETVPAPSSNTNIPETLARLRNLGMRVALDDFGQGYSGLSYLHQFDVDQLKIDRFYVAAINNNPQVTAILETIIELSNRLGFTLVAEGIETEEQRQFLRDRGVHFGQGWLFSRPMPIQEFERFLIER